MLMQGGFFRHVIRQVFSFPHRNLMSFPRTIEIGANLTDPVFRGVYHSRQDHLDDFDDMLARSWAANVDRIIITSSHLQDTKDALELCRRDERLFTTIGVHPCRSRIFDEFGDSAAYVSSMVDVARAHGNKIVAVGEFGLDYDRLFFADKDTQLKYFQLQFQLVDAVPHLPLFLHNRNTGTDFLDILRANRSRFRHGVVHSFTGTKEELQALLALDLYIGINGCSLKTAENLEVMAAVPLDRLMLETDAPWCEMRKSHASSPYVRTQFKSCKKEAYKSQMMVRGRNEPCTIVQVLEVVANYRKLPIEEVAKHAYENTMRVFFPAA